MDVELRGAAALRMRKVQKFSQLSVENLVVGRVSHRREELCADLGLEPLGVLL